MPEQRDRSRTPEALDATDRAILRLLQADSSLSLERIAQKANLSKTAVWNRIQRLQQNGVITRHTVLLDPGKVGLSETFFIAVRTAQHEQGWLDAFSQVVQDMPEITEAHRLAGEVDYLLKVQVPSTRDFDEFYKTLVSRISLYNVSSSLSMETMKQTTALPI